MVHRFVGKLTSYVNSATGGFAPYIFGIYLDGKRVTYDTKLTTTQLSFDTDQDLINFKTGDPIQFRIVDNGSWDQRTLWSSRVYLSDPAIPEYVDSDPLGYGIYGSFTYAFNAQDNQSGLAKEPQSTVGEPYSMFVDFDGVYDDSSYSFELLMYDTLCVATLDGKAPDILQDASGSLLSGTV